MYDPEFDVTSPPKLAANPAKKGLDGTTPPVDGNRWRTIWTEPRGTTRAILNSGRRHDALFLAMIFGVNALIGRVFRFEQAGLASLPTLLWLAVVGSLLGIAANFLSGSLIRWTGSWLGGRATAAECRVALAWGSVPLAVNVAIAIVLILAGVNPYRSQVRVPTDPSTAAVFLMTMPIRVVLSVWSAVLTVRTVAEALRISSWASLIAIILTGVIFTAAIGAIFAVGFRG